MAFQNQTPSEKVLGTLQPMSSCLRLSPALRSGWQKGHSSSVSSTLKPCSIASITHLMCSDEVCKRDVSITQASFTIR